VKKLLVILGLFLSTTAFAEQGDVWATIDTVGYHFQNDNKANDFNYGVGVNYEVVNRLSIGARVYRNSFKDGTMINGQPAELYSEAAVIDYRFWNDDLWATHIGWQFANHFGHSNGIVFPHMTDLPYASVCRKIGDADAKWQACGQVTTWKNTTNGWDQSASFKLQYTF